MRQADRTSGVTGRMGAYGVRYELDFATFGLEFEDGTCVGAAPIAKWCIGRTESELAAYWTGRGARISVAL